MRRTPENLEKYKLTCEKVMERASNLCEVLVDKNGKACAGVKNKKRCSKYIPFEQATYTNFLHKETRNGKSDDWVNDPDSIVFGCSSHHHEEEKTGIRVQSFDYGEEGEISYIPDEN